MKNRNKKKQERIINTTIDLFAECGVNAVSGEMVAKELEKARGGLYHHVKGKEEIIEKMVEIYDGLIVKNLKDISESMNGDIDAETILSSLFLAFSAEDSKIGRTISRIIFANYCYSSKISEYLSETFYEKREMRYAQIFNVLVANGKVKPFDTEAAARILNNIFIANALKDSFDYPFADNELSPMLDNLRKDCLLIINQILDGKF